MLLYGITPRNIKGSLTEAHSCDFYEGNRFLGNYKYNGDNSDALVTFKKESDMILVAKKIELILKENEGYGDEATDLYGHPLPRLKNLEKDSMNYYEQIFNYGIQLIFDVKQIESIFNKSKDISVVILQVDKEICKPNTKGNWICREDGHSLGLANTDFSIQKAAIPKIILDKIFDRLQDEFDNKYPEKLNFIFHRKSFIWE